MHSSVGGRSWAARNFAFQTVDVTLGPLDRRLKVSHTLLVFLQLAGVFGMTLCLDFFVILQQIRVPLTRLRQLGVEDVTRHFVALLLRRTGSRRG